MKNNKGFTLVETLAVLVILAILAAVAVPTMVGFIKDAKKKSYITEAAAVSTGVQAYIMERYAAGELDTYELYDDLMMHDLGDIEHPLTDLLEGSYTPGARITGLNLDEKPFKFCGITYQVESYEIEIVVGKEVKVRDLSE